jgi:hypothetical protein
LFDSSPAGDAWRDRFNFVILDYADRTNYHRDKDLLVGMTSRYLMITAMRCVMMGKSLTMMAPYRGNSRERQWMAEVIGEQLSGALGRAFSTVRFV